MKVMGKEISASPSQLLVAQKIAESIRAGKKVNIKAISEECGYSESYANTGLVVKKASFIDLLDTLMPEIDVRTRHAELMNSKSDRIRSWAIEHGDKLRGHVKNEVIIENKMASLSLEDLEAKKGELMDKMNVIDLTPESVTETAKDGTETGQREEIEPVVDTDSQTGDEDA